MAGVRDIAKAAGVSTATVSRVLSGSALVSEDLKRTVRAAAAALNYRPEMTGPGKRARGLGGTPRVRGGQRGAESISLYVPGSQAGKLHDRSVGYFAYVFSGMLKKVEEAGLSLNLTPYPPGQLAALLTGVQGRRAAAKGLLFLFTDRDEDRLLSDTAGLPPWIAVNRNLPGAELVVRTDERRGARAAAEYLLAQGHRRIGVLAGPPRFQFFEERLAGVKEGLADAKAPLPAALVARAELTPEGSRVAARQLLEQAQRPTAIFAAEEDFAAALLAVAQELGLRVPEDLSLVAASDFVLSAKRGRAVTAISTPAFELGYLAVETLINRARLAMPMRVEIVLQPALIVRESVAPPR